MPVPPQQLCLLSSHFHALVSKVTTESTFMCQKHIKMMEIISVG